MNGNKEKEDGGKTFTAMNENGKCYSFRLRKDATQREAESYARLWCSLAGCTEKIVKVWEKCG